MCIRDSNSNPPHIWIGDKIGVVPENRIKNTGVKQKRFQIPIGGKVEVQTVQGAVIGGVLHKAWGCRAFKSLQHIVGRSSSSPQGVESGFIIARGDSALKLDVYKRQIK